MLVARSSSALNDPSKWTRFPLRRLSGSPTLASGHNKWSTIKHKKGRNDGVKSKARTVLSQAIYIASRGGRPEPSLNHQLATVLERAKKENLPKAVIETAIARGQGKSVTGAPLEALTIEAMLPYSAGIVIECETDMKTKTLIDIRAIIKSAGGVQRATGFLFERKGRIVLEYKEGLSDHDVFDPAIEAGATDVDMDETGRIVLQTEPSELSSVSKSLQGLLDVGVESSELVLVPKGDQMVKLDEESKTQIDSVVELLMEEPSVQEVYINATSA